MSINLGLTAEDVAIFKTRYARRTVSHLTFRADNADYRAMLAREQDRAQFRNIAGTPRNMVYPTEHYIR